MQAQAENIGVPGYWQNRIFLRIMQPMVPSLSAVLALVATLAAAPGELPDAAIPEDQGAMVGEIVLHKSNVFDLSDPEENYALYRLANRLHIVTKDKTITKQLLLASGERFSQRLMEESERILRRNGYLYDASIKPVLTGNGTVDLEINTRDVWSLSPELSLSRSGGENKSQVGLEELNLLGRGQRLSFVVEDDVDRRSQSFEFSDRNIANSWVSTHFRIADTSDGKSNYLAVFRPFYALDTRWSAGGAILDDDRRSSMYYLGNEAAEYQHARNSWSMSGGWSKGLVDGAALRWNIGVARDDNRFSTVSNPTLPAVIPDDRDLAYVFVATEFIVDDFDTSRNRDQIGRTEDFQMGTHLTASLGWSDTSFGADRDALIYRGSYRRGFGSLEKNTLLVNGSISGRVESGDAVNSLLGLGARYYRTQSEKRLFFATLSATAGSSLDLDNPVELGGDTGLRGYPLRYQTGESSLLLTIEQRYFTDWYPFRLARIGGAIFADVGRVWGDNPVGDEPRGWLTDVGFGLRFARTRSSSGKMIHLDVAFPLDGDDSIDSVQILLESKASF